MSTTEAQKQANKKYHEKLVAFTIRMKPNELARYKKAAETAGQSFRGFVLAAMDEKIKESRGSIK